METSTEGEYGNDTLAYNYDYDLDDALCNLEAVIRFGSTVVPIFFTIVVPLSLIGNVLVLVVTGLYPRKSLTDIFILNLAVSDLIFTLGLPFLACYHVWSWTFGDFMCKAVNCVVSVGFYSSTVFLIMMATHSYVAVVHPQSVWNRWHRFVWPIVAWMVSFAAALPALLYSKVMADPTDFKNVYCEYDGITVPICVKYGQNISLVVAFLIMVFCYMRILKIIRRSGTNKHRDIRLVFCVVLVFFISWAPYNIVTFLGTLIFYNIEPFTRCDVSIYLYYAFYVCTLLAYSHCCFNLVLHLLVNVKFQSHLKTLLKCFYVELT